MSVETAQKLTRIILYLTIPAYASYDLIIYLLYGRAATISHQMYLWSLENKYFAVGVCSLAAVLCVHFFWGFSWIENLFRRGK